MNDGVGARNSRRYCNTEVTFRCTKCLPASRPQRISVKRIHNKLSPGGFINVPNQIDTGPMVQISEIRLRRTDTTLDLSQKAEKV